MGAYLFVIVCTGLWIAFGWALATRPMVLDRAWARVRGRPLVAKRVTDSAASSFTSSRCACRCIGRAVGDDVHTGHAIGAHG